MRQLELPTERPTQKRRVLALLRAGSACLQDVPLDLSYTFRNRVSELRREGYRIESAPCHVHNHRAPVVRYLLTGEPHGH